MKEVLVGIVLGSDSDLPLIEEAEKTLGFFGIGYEIIISSAHRTPRKTANYALSAEKRGIEVIIAGAGGAAHLAGFLAAHTTLPVIGIPLPSSDLKGMDALLSTVQMPGGVPVATMAIGKAGAKNAAILAAQILALKYPSLREKMKEYKGELIRLVEEKNKKLKERRS